MKRTKTVTGAQAVKQLKKIHVKAKDLKPEKRSAKRKGKAKMAPGFEKVELKREPKQVELPLNVKPGKPNFKQLSEEAEKNLTSFRAALSKEALDQYMVKKWYEVRRLAREAGVDGLTIADITAAEEASLKVRG
jgi:hypothetical protein